MACSVCQKDALANARVSFELVEVRAETPSDSAEASRIGDDYITFVRWTTNRAGVCLLERFLPKRCVEDYGFFPYISFKNRRPVIPGPCCS